MVVIFFFGGTQGVCCVGVCPRQPIEFGRTVAPKCVAVLLFLFTSVDPMDEEHKDSGRPVKSEQSSIYVRILTSVSECLDCHMQV